MSVCASSQCSPTGLRPLVTISIGDTISVEMADLARKSRQWLTNRLTGSAIGAAPLLPGSAVRMMEALVGWAGPKLPVLGGMVAGNLKAAGLYSPAVYREYFIRAAAHLAGAVQVFRYGRSHHSGRPHKMHSDLARLVEERVFLDDSFDRLRHAAAMGKGVVLMGTHASNFLLVLARINQELPITVYLRHSRDPRKQETKKRWCEICGLDFIAEPPSAANPMRRAEIMADALSEKRILIITPDLAQKREDGVPVRLLGREVYLPAGAAAISQVVQAPLVTVLASPAPSGDRAITLRFFGPMEARVQERRRGWRQAAIQDALQWYTDLLAGEFLARYPALWFLWGDKRWTRVFRGDPRYTRTLDPA